MDVPVCCTTGHYVSLIKSKNTWLYFDDDTVDIINEATVAATFGSTQASCKIPCGPMDCRAGAIVINSC